MNPWRGRRRKVWNSAERSTLQNPQEAFRVPKQYKTWEQFRAKWGLKAGLTSLGHCFLTYTVMKNPPLQFLWELNVRIWNKRPQSIHQHTYLMCLQCLGIYFNLFPYLGKMKMCSHERNWMTLEKGLPSSPTTIYKWPSLMAIGPEQGNPIQMHTSIYQLFIASKIQCAIIEVCLKYTTIIWFIFPDFTQWLFNKS